MQLLYLGSPSLVCMVAAWCQDVCKRGRGHAHCMHRKGPPGKCTYRFVMEAPWPKQTTRVVMA
eukprot:2342704-Amphidinium_carterae.1